MGNRHGRYRPARRVVQEGGGLQALGLVLIAAGLTLLFLCIPGWAWAALSGAVLVAAGYALLCAGRR